MNYKLVFNLISKMLCVEAAFMFFPLIVSFIYNEDDKTKAAFMLTIIILAVFGILMSIMIKPTNEKTKFKDAFAAAAISWILFSLFGALPFYFSGYFPSFADCFFESVSGFTTTGATVLSEIELLPKGIIFWRSFSHWMGGVGVLVFILAVIPSMNASSINLLRVEGTGPSPDRFLPKLSETARMMYIIYISMTMLTLILLIVSGLPIYDALIHAFSTAGTGGFSSLTASVGGYNNLAVEIIITIFMFLFGVNFTLYFYLIKRDFKQIYKDEELRLYFLIVIVAIVIMTIDLTGFYGSVSEALRHSSFQASSVITTTGFATTDFDLWPVTSRIILIVLMITGACAGSTSGGIKLIRFLLLFKLCITEMKKMVHPKSVKSVAINGKAMDNDTIAKTAAFFFVYFFIFIVASLFVALDGHDIVSTLSSVVATLSNAGHGFGIAGPSGDYSQFSGLSKTILSFCMIAGRLEIFPLLVLLNPTVWKKS